MRWSKPIIVTCRGFVNASGHPPDLVITLYSKTPFVLVMSLIELELGGCGIIDQSVPPNVVYCHILLSLFDPTKLIKSKLLFRQLVSLAIKNHYGTK